MAIARFDAPTVEALCGVLGDTGSGPMGHEVRTLRSRRSFDADQLTYAVLDAEVLLALHERHREVGGAAAVGGGQT